MAPQTQARLRRLQNSVTAETDVSQPDRQSSDDSTDKDRVQRMADEMREKAKARREKRRADITNAHKVSVKKLHSSFDAELDGISKRLDKAHRERIEKLCNLIQRRTAVEADLLASCKRIEDAYELAKRLLENAISCRLRDLGRLRDVNDMQAANVALENRLSEQQLFKQRQ
ncbi:hypothetical protein MMC21_004564 [Puttea exsequens]|nr:hypothetical protein [Puttea exsequens]